MYCSRCGSTACFKNGKMRGKQRFRCKGCGYNFTNSHGRGYPPALKLQAFQLYTENMGIRSIARFLGVSPSTVMRWLRDEGRDIMAKIKNSLPDALPPQDIIEIDEMWHYTQKNAENYGYGLLYLASHDAFSPSKLALVALKR